MRIHIPVVFNLLILAARWKNVDVLRLLLERVEVGAKIVENALVECACVRCASSEIECLLLKRWITVIKLGKQKPKCLCLLDNAGGSAI